MSAPLSCVFRRSRSLPRLKSNDNDIREWHGYGVCSCSCLPALVHPPTQSSSPVAPLWLRPPQLVFAPEPDHSPVTALPIHNHAPAVSRALMFVGHVPPPRHPSRLREKNECEHRPVFAFILCMIMTVHLLRAFVGHVSTPSHINPAVCV
jgi:hypothetical protein